jgi:hypothetical protein
MKQNLKLLALIAAIGGLAMTSRADLTNTFQSFNSYTVGDFNPNYGFAYNYGGGSGLAAIVTNGMVNGANISGNAVEFTAAVSGINSDNVGVHSVDFDMPLANNFSPNKADYNVSFDMALGSNSVFTSVSDFTASFVLYGGDGITGQEYAFSGTNLPTPGAGFKHYSINMNSMGGAYAKTALVMNTITNMSWSLGKYHGAAAGTVDFFIDNILITTTVAGVPVPVAITTQPTSQTVFAGQAATFTVASAGYPLPTFQWMTNGVSVAGATNKTYTVFSATTNMSGIFVTVLVSNTFPSSALSTNNVTLTVVPASGSIMAFTSLSASPTANAGYLQGYGTFTIANGYPAVSANVPSGPDAPSGNSASVDFGTFTNYATQGGGRAINFANTIDASGAPVGNLGGFGAFTACGWVNCASIDQGYGGNRIVFCGDGSGSIGFDVTTYLDPFSNVGIKLGVNGYSDSGGNPQSSGLITVDPANGSANWVFFAVTYDGTLTSQNVSFYFGNGATPAALDWTTDYNKGPIAKSGMLSIGNANQNTWFANGSGSAGDVRSFRGMIDEVHVYNKVLTLEEIQAAQVAPASTNVVVIAPTPVPLNISSSGANVILNWTDPTGLFRLAAGTNVTGITNVVSTTSPYTNPVSGSQSFFRLIYP